MGWLTPNSVSVAKLESSCSATLHFFKLVSTASDMDATIVTSKASTPILSFSRMHSSFAAVLDALAMSDSVVFCSDVEI